ncbi:MAG: histidine--tRNA ligase [Candidatus Kapabacteria bacterium]|nr:histidine--tRNA ligase [Candidatus Kapabacteria bacterium]
MSIGCVRGTRDLFGAELEQWQRAEDVFRTVSAAFGYQEFRTPIIEHTELFARGVGEHTDIVGKEMYTFLDRGGDSITLRPEMTAPIVRAAIEHSLVRHAPVTRLWYMGPLFRYERPQKGRYRQFHQYGAECLGSAEPEADAEIIILAHDVIRKVGVQRVELRLNTLGSPSARAAYREALVAYLEQHVDQLSEESTRRLHTNPLRVLDSKDERDRPVVASAPRLTDYLDDESTSHFRAVCSMLDAAGIAYTVDPLMVRGLDYYSHTVFEFVTDALGTQNAVCGGGRYDPLFSMLGGGNVPAVGFSIGIERLLMLLEVEQGGWAEPKGVDVYLCSIGPAAVLPGSLIALRLRRSGVTVATDLLRRSAKAQFKEANRLRATFTVTLGDDELAAGTVVVKNMQTGEQQTIASGELDRFVLAAR